VRSLVERTFLYPENPAIVAGLHIGYADEKKKNEELRKTKERVCRDRRPRLSKKAKGKSKVLVWRIGIKIQSVGKWLAAPEVLQELNSL